ncbi:helix-turn-helix transcriptional regulator [Cellulosimicrobium cellulans]|uniref:helix-turn-helix transcriptional regulator n=1 Tax=Cellulosimicrobium cellulans TaxID=1710 RepID=UPI0020CB6E77|nr:ArsR family transcriptional regulator [Cellulosimicrobium cellulans]
MPEDTSTTYRALASSSRLTLLHALQERGPMTVADLSREAALCPSATREHLQRLADAGFVRSAPEVRTTRGRPRILYEAIAGEDPPRDDGAARRLGESLVRAALTRAVLEHDDAAQGPAHAPAPGSGDDLAGTARAAGRRLADVLRSSGREAPAPTSENQLAALDDHLHQLGLDPELEEERLRFHLYRCPFLALAADREDVVCAVHLGLVQGVLAGVGGPVRAEALLPFVEPHHCVLQLSRAG